MKDVSRLLRRQKVLAKFRQVARALRTYLSENALLPAQVNTKYGYDDYQYVYQHEATLKALTPENRTAWIEDQFLSMGLETHRHAFACSTGVCENVYAVLRAPRADGSESLVLTSAWANERLKSANVYGVLSTLSLAKFWKRFSYWAKDVVLVVGDNVESLEGWVDAYHTPQQGVAFARAGSIQAALHLEFPVFYFKSLGIEYDGYLGQQPNLDLINTVHRIATANSVHVSLHGDGDLGSRDDANDYEAALLRLLHAIGDQARAQPSGPHAAFKSYGIDAITLRGLEDVSTPHLTSINTLATVLESTFRSLNNLLEKFHQSFFFYLLSSAEHFASIMVYIPAAILLNVSLLVAALGIWLETGDAHAPVPHDHTANERPVAAPLATLVAAFAWGGATVLFTSSTEHRVAMTVLATLVAVASPKPTTATHRHLLACFALTTTALTLLAVSTIHYARALVAVTALALPWLAIAHARSGSPALAIALLMHPATLVAVLPSVALTLGSDTFPAIGVAVNAVHGVVGMMGPALFWGLYAPVVAAVWPRMARC
ncbi:Glycosyl phosphatidyl inositol protein transamidase complex subunit [Blastocladiella emersonii ATCC 22665]|nr:Glycosyl phosphatidyl inositol protein transamidase complex subunit [Blastocladiella emersonii ATCC 22665]